MVKNPPTIFFIFPVIITLCLKGAEESLYPLQSEGHGSHQGREEYIRGCETSLHCGSHLRFSNWREIVSDPRVFEWRLVFDVFSGIKRVLNRVSTTTGNFWKNL